MSHLCVKSDHVCLVFNTNMYTSTVENIKPRYAYHRGNCENINQNRKQIDWYKRLENINAENAWVFLEEVLSNEIEKKRKRIRTKKRMPYINRHAERKIKKKYYLWKRLKDTNLGKDHEEYKKQRNSLCELTRKLQKYFEKDLIKKLKKDPKAFWLYTNSKLKTRSTISQLSRKDSTLTQTEEQQAQVLNEFFSSVFTEEDLSQILNLEKIIPKGPIGKHPHNCRNDPKKKKEVNQLVQMESLLES